MCCWTRPCSFCKFPANDHERVRPHLERNPQPIMKRLTLRLLRPVTRNSANHGVLVAAYAVRGAFYVALSLGGLVFSLSPSMLLLSRLLPWFEACCISDLAIERLHVSLLDLKTGKGSIARINSPLRQQSPLWSGIVRWFYYKKKRIISAFPSTAIPNPYRVLLTRGFRKSWLIECKFKFER